MKKRRLVFAVVMLLLSATLLSTASFAWFSMNTDVNVTGIEIEAFSDSIFIEISGEREGEYAYSTAVLPSDKAVRPVTGVRLEDGAVTVNVTAVPAGTRYTENDPQIKNKDYYLKVDASSSNDSYEGDNYILVNSRLEGESSVAGYYKSENITFGVVTSAIKYDGTGTYYKKVGNSYIKETSLTAELSELRGLYTVSFGIAETADSVFDGSSNYYESRSDGIYPVGGLKLGTKLDGFYTVETASTLNKGDGVTKCYVKNARGDYVCIGTPDEGEDLKNYFYWARSYSTDIEDHQGSNTLSVIKENKLSDYYYQHKFYIKTAKGTDTASNLRVEEVNVVGEDSLSNSVRILFVAENGAGEVARAMYNNRTGQISHWDGENGEEILFDKLLGNGEDIVEVEIYIYFDGTDSSVVTKDAELFGESISIKFAVDKQ